MLALFTICAVAMFLFFVNFLMSLLCGAPASLALAVGAGAALASIVGAVVGMALAAPTTRRE